MKSTIPQSDAEAQIRVLLEQGIQAAQEGDSVRADRFLQAVLDRDPDHEEAWLWRAALAESPEQGVAYLERVLAINPDNVRAQAGLRWVRERRETVEPPPQVPERPGWGGVVALAPLGSGRRGWRLWHVVGLIAALLLAGGLLWWWLPRLLELVSLVGPQPTATVLAPTAGSPAAQVPSLVTATPTPSPLPPTATTVPSVTPSPLLTTATTAPSVTPSRVAATVTSVPSSTPSSLPATATSVPPATPSPLPATATIAPTAPSSPVPTPATVWPTPGPTGPPVVTPRPTEPSSSD